MHQRKQLSRNEGQNPTAMENALWDGEIEILVTVLAQYSAENSQRIAEDAEAGIRNRLYHLWNRIARLDANNEGRKRVQKNIFHANNTTRQQWGPRSSRIPSIVDAWQLGNTTNSNSHAAASNHNKLATTGRTEPNTQ